MSQHSQMQMSFRCLVCFMVDGADAKDANKNPKNIRHATQTIKQGKPLKVKLANAGGYVALIKPASK